jgi:hypothetical protein
MNLQRMRRASRIIVGTLMILSMGTLVWATATWYPRFAYLQWELPVMQQAVAKLSGVTMIGVYESGGVDEFAPIMLLEIEDRGSLLLYAPNISSFTGGGNITIRGIAECQQTIPLHLSDPVRRQEKRIYVTVAEVINDYDQIVQEARTGGICQTRIYRDLLWGRYP